MYGKCINEIIQTKLSIVNKIGLTKKYKARLQCTQNKVIRFLLNAPARTHIGANEFRKVGMLPVELRVKQLKLNLVHNIINGKAPNYLSESIKLTRNHIT